MFKLAMMMPNDYYWWKYLPKGVSYVEYDYHTGKVLNVIGKPLWFWEV